MGGEKGERQIAKGRKTIRLSWRFLIAGAFFILAVALLVFIFWPIRLDWERIGNRWVRDWNRENQEDLRQFKQLAKEHGWVMYARHAKGSLGLLDLSTMNYRRIYLPRPGRWVLNASASRERIAFTECRARRRGEDYACTDFEVGIVEVHGSVTSVTKAPLEDESLSGDREAHAVAVGKDIVLCLSKERAHVYDISSRTLRTVYELEEAEQYDRKRRALVVGDEFLLLFISQGTISRSRNRLIALEASGAYGVLSELDSVWCPNAMVVGGQVLIEKDEGCFLYNPRSGETEKLVCGRLLSPLADNAFLFREKDILHRYNLNKRSAEVLWRASRGGYGDYDYTRFIVSPERLFLFAPSDIRSAMSWEFYRLAYEVYDLKSGERRGAFHAPFAGRRFLEFLGWVEEKAAE